MDDEGWNALQTGYAKKMIEQIRAERDAARAERDEARALLAEKPTDDTYVRSEQAFLDEVHDHGKTKAERDAANARVRDLNAVLAALHTGAVTLCERCNHKATSHVVDDEADSAGADLLAPYLGVKP